MRGPTILYAYRRSYDPKTRLWTAEETATGTRAHGTTHLQAEARLRRKMAEARKAKVRLDEGSDDE